MATAKKRGTNKTDTKKIVVGGGALLVGYLLYRNMHASATTTVAGAGAGQQTAASIAPYTPQPPVTLSSGETVYDPNTGELLGGSGTAPAPSSYTINVKYPKTLKVRKNSRKPTKRPVLKRPKRPVKHG